MSRRRRAALATCALATALSGGCASSWVMDTQVGGDLLQWPPRPQPARVRFVTAVNGFRESGHSAARLLFGRGDQRILRPVAVAVAADGRIAIADPGARCVHLFQPAAGRYLRVATGGGADLAAPVGVAFGAAGRLYVADSGLGKVFAIAPDGTTVQTIDRAGERPLGRPTGLAYDPDRDVLYVADTREHRIHAFDAAGRLLFSFGERGEEAGRFNFPTHLFFAPPGALYVTDALNFRVQKLDPQGAVRAVVGHHGDGTGDVALPKGVAADRDGVIYLADALFDTVQLFDDQGEFLLSIGGRGGDPGELLLPSGVFVGVDDRLYVCDTGNGRVAVYQILRGAPAAPGEGR